MGNTCYEIVDHKVDVTFSVKSQFVLLFGSVDTEKSLRNVWLIEKLKSQNCFFSQT